MSSESCSGRQMATMRPIRETIPLDEAVVLVATAAVPIPRTELISIHDANDRVLAEDVVSALDVPPFDRAAMDGYAVVAEDTFGAGRYDAKILRCIEKVYTGEVPSRRIARGECIEIATGAPMPEGANAVVMVEETERAAGSGDVRVFTPVYPRQHVGSRGADITAGQRILSQATVLNPSRIGALAAIGMRDARVFAKPRVAILSTGNEIVEPGSPLAPGRFTTSTSTPSHRSSVHMAVSRCRAGRRRIICRTSRQRFAPQPARTSSFFRAAVRLASEICCSTHCRRRERSCFTASPSNPASRWSSALSDRLPCSACPATRPRVFRTLTCCSYPCFAPSRIFRPYRPLTVTLPLSRRIVSTTGRHQFYTVRIVENQAVPAFKASGDITSMAHADGYIEIPAQTDIVEAGELVEVKLF